MKRRIEINYAFVQLFYWVGACALSGFTTVYLSSMGLSDANIGNTTAIIAIISIFVQLFVSRFADSHSNIEIKYIVVTMYATSMILCAIFNFIKLPIFVLMIMFAIAASLQSSEYGLLNSIYTKYKNQGYDVEYGWPRGFGSIGYALIAFFLGRLIAKYQPSIVIYVYLIAVVFAILSVLFLPKQETNTEDKKEEASIGYVALLKKNKTLLLFLIASIFSAVGAMSVAMYLIRIIEGVGKTTAELGIAMLIQSGAEIPSMFASKYVLKKFKPITLLLVSFIASLAKVFLLSKASSMSVIYICMALSVFCYGIYGFASVIFVNDIVENSESVRGQSLVTLCYNGGISSIIGGALAGILMDKYGLNGLFNVSIILCFVSILILLLCIKTQKKEKNQ